MLVVNQPVLLVSAVWFVEIEPRNRLKSIKIYNTPLNQIARLYSRPLSSLGWEYLVLRDPRSHISGRFVFLGSWPLLRYDGDNNNNSSESSYGTREWMCVKKLTISIYCLLVWERGAASDFIGKSCIDSVPFVISWRNFPNGPNFCQIALILTLAVTSTLKVAAYFVLHMSYHYTKCSKSRDNSFMAHSGCRNFCKTTTFVQEIQWYARPKMMGRDDNHNSDPWDRLHLAQLLWHFIILHGLFASSCGLCFIRL